MKRLVIASLLPLLLLPAACRKSSEKAAEEMAERIIESQAGGKADVDISGGKITIKGQEGTVEFAGGEGVTLPADFPKDVPLYPGATVLSYVNLGNDGRQAVLKTGDDVADVHGFYGKKLPAEGWKVTQEMKMETAYTLMGEKGSRQASVVIGKDDGQSTIALTITERG